VFALVILSAVLLAASVGLALRLGYPRRSETALAAGIFGSALILIPVYALGLTSQLYRGRLIAASAVVLLLALGASFIGVNAKAHGRAILREIWMVFRLPFDGLRITWSERGLAMVGAAAVLLIVAWSGVASYAAASDSWDGIGYHEPMIGYTIQEHSMMRPAVVQRLVFFEAINGNPRHCEMTALWLVMLVDRRMIELPNTLASPIFLLAMYLLCRRLGVLASSSIGWACAAFLMPGCILLLRSTYIDLHVAAFSMASVYLCTRPGFRVRDAWPAAVAVGLMLGAKVTSLAWAPPLALAAMVILAMHLVRQKDRRGRVLAVMAGATAVAAVLGGVLYIRNQVLFHSPIWPFGLEIKSLGLNFPGIQSGLSAATTEQHKPMAEVWNNITTVFKPGYDYADTRVYGYGQATAFLLLPLGLVGAVTAVIDLVRALRARLLGVPLPNQEAIYAFAFIGVYGFACAYFSPGLWQARYNLHVVCILILACARVSVWPRLERLSSGAMAIAVFVNLVWLYWAEPGLQPKPGQLVQLLKLPAEERAARRMNPWTLDDDVARARDQRLRPGDLLVYTDSFLFIGNMWNETFSNRIEWWPIRPPADMIPSLEKAGTKWVVTGTGSGLASALAADKKWRKVGRMCHQSSAFERVSF
jgi:hypothetical protein